MAITNNQQKRIWEAIGKWMNKCNVDHHYVSLRLANVIPPYTPDRIARGLNDGSEPISSDFLHQCVSVFNIVRARNRGEKDNLTDEDCIALLTAIFNSDSDQGKLKLF